MSALTDEIARRRTFAIISHPDAGKTTLTEKFLLYAGAVESAGAVRARKNMRHATSDWMAMERERGISVSSTVLEFEYEGLRYNLLDTPGHQDFSEDTYRTMIAADSAIMVLDAAKGIEPQTRKLYEVCRTRNLPIITFVNKMDHDALDPLELLGHIESVLGITATPVTWPIGDGPSFQGVYDMAAGRVMRFERTAHGAHRAPVVEGTLADANGTIEAAIGGEALARLRESVSLLEAAVAPFDRERFLAGTLTPVYFGSAINNFGIEALLGAVRDIAPSPPSRDGLHGPIDPASEAFSGFIFKIQANMDPQHRDCMAFVRVCSGRFEPDLKVTHTRTGKQLRLSRARRVFAQERETVEEAYPGDIIGIVNPGALGIGDTLTTDAAIEFEPIPRFQPECFARLRNRDVLRSKQFTRGLAQLEQEGAVQVMWEDDGQRGAPVVGAVGELQFEVVVRRLADEYSVEANIEPLIHTTLRIIGGEAGAVRWPGDALRLSDAGGQPLVLLRTARDVSYLEGRYSGLELGTLAG